MGNKPMIVAIEEAEQMLVGAVNNALANGVTPYFLGMVFDKVHGQVKELAQREMKTVRENWQKEIADEATKTPENP
jgi:hypothetical protein